MFLTIVSGQFRYIAQQIRNKNKLNLSENKLTDSRISVHSFFDLLARHMVEFKFQIFTDSHFTDSHITLKQNSIEFQSVN